MTGKKWPLNQGFNNSILNIFELNRKVPLFQWIVLVLLFFSTSILNNWAFGFQIPMTLHIIFRSSTIMVSMILSFVIFNQKYTLKEITGVVLVSIGIVKSTVSSAPTLTQNQSDWIIGVVMLTSTVIIACFLGIMQQKTYTKYGFSLHLIASLFIRKHWREGLFYTHFLALPLFVFFKSQIITSILEYNKNNTWIYLVGNVATQYLCVSGVTRLSSKCTSVTLNLVLTVRKFVSLLLSVLFFNHTFGVDNWIGAGLVMLGTVIYSYEFRNSVKENKKIK